MSHLPLPGIGTIDDLLERARRGVAAGSALDIVKDKLAALRDDKYRKMLNERDPQRRLQLCDELKAIESLAQSLLVDEAQGELAYQALMQGVGGNEPPKEEPLKVARVARKRRPRASGITATS